MFRLTRLSLANRALVALITILVAGVGLFSMANLKQELIPSISMPQTMVITTLPGASPEVIDEQVSLPLSKAIASVADVEQVVATSSSSVSMLSVSYTYGVDAAEFKRALEGALDSVTSLPDGATPEVIAGSIADFPIIFVTASSDKPVSELSAALAQIAVPELESIDGVRAATVSGAQGERITITPDMAALAAAGLSVMDLSTVLDANGLTLPVGSIAENGEMLSVQAGSALTSLDDLKSLPLASATQPGAVVTLGSVADVALVPEALTSITRTNGVPSLSLSITATADADVVATSHAVEDTLDTLRTELGSDVELTTLFSQAPFIEDSISHLATEGVLGLVFAILVILVFLLSVRSTLVTAISIPLSVLVTFTGLYLGGYSLNMLTLGALTIAIGRVVDDSIVVIENIKRHLSYGEPKKQSILTGVREVSSAITASTLTTVAVFLPIAMVGGMVGELFRPFALTVAIAMVSSLLVALTIVPVLSYWFLKRPEGVVDVAAARAAAEEKEHRGALQRAYKPILRSTQRHPVITVVASVLLLVLTVSLVPLLKVDFLGSTGQNMLMVTQEFTPGTDLDAIGEGATQVEDALAEIDGVGNVMMTAGSGGEGLAAMMGGGGGTASYIITTDAGADQAALKTTVENRLAQITDAGTITVPESGGMGFSSTVDVVVTAPDETVLDAAAETVTTTLSGLEHTSDFSSDRAAAQPTLQIVVDRVAALEHGLTEMQVVGIVAGTVSPQSIGGLRIDNHDYKIFVDSGATPQTTAEISGILLPTPAGLVPLSDVASIDRVTVPTTITRQDAELVATLSITPDEGELGQVTSQVTSRLDTLDLPDGATASIGGLAELQGDSFSQLGLAMLIAIAIVYLLMVAAFRSLVQPLILLVSIPFAATGAIVLLLLTGKPLGISALIGMLMLIGIVVTNAIVLIDLVNQYRRQGQSVEDAVFNGARQRLRPIVMTALATIFALVPMALGVTGSSGFISQDLAIVVIGGLLSSTALTLVLVPVLYRLIEGRRKGQPSDDELLVVDAGDADLVPVG
ncbi:hydrophobic/amphiphilic exporter-1, HAE1 family [Sanguibacter gelidistatuariae]|uniref:Hydrophobic/amphiphilic exporter-1, HAE1 family n=1 Tax=Sanguibacter gelidistatuariae TaxID=1814289 RepID=A0A1G6GT77_9MICO|nr:efflux RND transporter permease subunit [Sanguibacter gelidistatuariae]SDB85230.1 hydrophobic/amphiphilic exporter-1, HAE1 family [Sanguibacter gelidistatuariae]